MDVKKSIEERRAYRSLIPCRIGDEIISELAEAARLAPSCFNKQPWRYVFIRESSALEQFRSALSTQNSWAYDASLIIAVISEESLDCRLKDGRKYYLYDTGIASGFIFLRATELGLVAHPMAGYDQQKAAELLSIPEGMSVINIIAVGKHDEDFRNKMEQDDINIEENRPERMGLSGFVSIDKFGNPF